MQTLSKKQSNSQIVSETIEQQASTVEYVAESLLYLNNGKYYVTMDSVTQLEVQIDPAMLLPSNMGQLVPLDHLNGLGVGPILSTSK